MLTRDSCCTLYFAPGPRGDGLPAQGNRASLIPQPVLILSVIGARGSWFRPQRCSRRRSGLGRADRRRFAFCSWPVEVDFSFSLLNCRKEGPSVKIYQVSGIDAEGDVITYATVDTAALALVRLQEARARCLRAWVSDETGNDVSPIDLMARADEEQRNSSD